MRTFVELDKLAEEYKLQILSVEKAKELKGKKIQYISYGYAGQDNIGEITVGNIKEDNDKFTLLDANGKDTCMYAYKDHPSFPNDFTIGDMDRFVLFIEVE